MRMAYETREMINEFFNGDGPEQVAFMSNATEALNTAIDGTVSYTHLDVYKRQVQRDEKGEFDESKASSRCAGSIVIMYLYDYAG